MTTSSSDSPAAASASAATARAWLNSQMKISASVEIRARRFGFCVLSISTSSPPARYVGRLGTSRAGQRGAAIRSTR